MNKMIKGSVAGATGIALLMGGFGTYALWSDSVHANGGSIRSGRLDIVSTGTGTWHLGTPDAAPMSSTDFANFLMVPGDKLVLTQPLEVSATGTNLKARLDVTGIENTFSKLRVTVSYGEKSDVFTGSWDKASTHGLSYVGSTEIGSLNTASNTIADQAVITFDLPADGQDAVDGTTDQGAHIDLSDVTVTLHQVSQ